MKASEKKLLTAVVIVGGGFGLVTLGPHIATPITGMKTKLAEKENKLADLNRSLAMRGAVHDRYLQIAAITGATDTVQRANALKIEISRLASESHLSKPSVSAGSPLTDRKSLTSVVSINLTGEGDLSAIRALLLEFYKRLDYARIASLTLTPVNTPSGGPGGRGRERGNGKESDLMKLDLKVEAFCLAPDPQVSPAAVEQAQAPEQKSRLGEMENAYAMLTEREIFWPYKAPPAPEPPKVQPPPEIKPVVKPAEPPPVVAPPPIPPPPPPPPRPAWQGHVGRGTTSIVGVVSYGVAEVMISDTRDRSEDFVKLGGELDGGEIVLIHPMGVLVRRPDDTEYLYPIGKLLSESVELSQADEYPEIRAVIAQMVGSPPSNE